jgi:hypothetical protein
MSGAYGVGIAAVASFAENCEVAMWVSLWIAAHVVMIGIACNGRSA